MHDYRTEALSRVGQTAIRGIPGGLIAPTVNRMGASIVIDQLLQLAMDGHTYHAQQGNAATLLDFAEVAYDEDQPQFALRVPAGTVVIPLSVKVNFQDQAQVDTHVILGISQNDIGDGTSTSLTITPMRTDGPYATRCFANSLYTANATAATNLIEIDRVIDPFVATAAGRLPGYRWDIKSATVIPILVGPATLQLWTFAAVDGPGGFAEYVWAEIDKTALETP